MSWLIIHEWVLLAIAALLGFLLCWLFCRKKGHDTSARDIEFEELRKKYTSCQEERAILQEKIKSAPKVERPPEGLNVKPTDFTGGGLKLYDSPTEGVPDDLKRIKGVGVKLEKTLNEMGIYYYKQISSWSQSQVEEVNDRLKFKGRIGRENWVEQAKILATGQDTDFAKRYDQ